MKRRINFRVCTNDYRCGKCDFDQFFHDEYSVAALVKPVDVLHIQGFRVPQGYYFHRGHTWIKIEEGSMARVGIDEFALRLLGPLDRIETPLMGKEVEQGRADIQIIRGENRARLLSPVTGVVTAFNHRARDDGSLVNDDPYTEGWIMSVHADALRQDLKNLMINNETSEFMGKELDRLYDLIEEVAGPLSVDGGHLGKDIYGGMPQLGWERLTEMFLV
jgi:glycine cleavage system H lipoate-binding protein